MVSHAAEIIRNVQFAVEPMQVSGVYGTNMALPPLGGYPAGK